MTYQHKPELSHLATIYRPNIFKVSDNEIYMIKDSNLKKINEILRINSQSKPFSEGIHIEPDVDKHNKNLLASMKLTTDLYRQIFDIKEVEDNFQGLFENKYKDFKKYLRKTKRKERLQKVINTSLQYSKTITNFPDEKENTNPSVDKNNHNNNENGNSNEQK